MHTHSKAAFSSSQSLGALGVVELMAHSTWLLSSAELAVWGTHSSNAQPLWTHAVMVFVLPVKGCFQQQMLQSPQQFLQSQRQSMQCPFTVAVPAVSTVTTPHSFGPSTQPFSILGVG